MSPETLQAMAMAEKWRALAESVAGLAEQQATEIEALRRETADLREKAADLKRMNAAGARLTRFRFFDGLRVELLDGDKWREFNVEEAVRICERARHWYTSQDVANGVAMVDVVGTGGDVVDPTFRGALARALTGVIKLHEHASKGDANG